jgi:hypothetical protein
MGKWSIMITRCGERWAKKHVLVPLQIGHVVSDS